MVIKVNNQTPVASPRSDFSQVADFGMPEENVLAEALPGLVEMGMSARDTYKDAKATADAAATFQAEEERILGLLEATAGEDGIDQAEPAPTAVRENELNGFAEKKSEIQQLEELFRQGRSTEYAKLSMNRITRTLLARNPGNEDAVFRALGRHAQTSDAAQLTTLRDALYEEKRQAAQTQATKTRTELIARANKSGTPVHLLDSDPPAFMEQLVENENLTSQAALAQARAQKRTAEDTLSEDGWMKDVSDTMPAYYKNTTTSIDEMLTARLGVSSITDVPALMAKDPAAAEQVMMEIDQYVQSQADALDSMWADQLGANQSFLDKKKADFLGFYEGYIQRIGTGGASEWAKARDALDKSRFWDLNPQLQQAEWMSGTLQFMTGLEEQAGRRQISNALSGLIVGALTKPKPYSYNGGTDTLDAFGNPGDTGIDIRELLDAAGSSPDKLNDDLDFLGDSLISYFSSTESNLATKEDLIRFGEIVLAKLGDGLIDEYFRQLEAGSRMPVLVVDKVVKALSMPTAQETLQQMSAPHAEAFRSSFDSMLQVEKTDLIQNEIMGTIQEKFTELLTPTVPGGIRGIYGQRRRFDYMEVNGQRVRVYDVVVPVVNEMGVLSYELADSPTTPFTSHQLSQMKEMIDDLQPAVERLNRLSKAQYSLTNLESHSQRRNTEDLVNSAYASMGLPIPLRRGAR